MSYYFVLLYGNDFRKRQAVFRSLVHDGRNPVEYNYCVLLLAKKSSLLNLPFLDYSFPNIRLSLLRDIISTSIKICYLQ